MKLSRETQQKRIIESEVNKMSSFFTGEDLFKKVHKLNNQIGLATVYRFLKNLREKKLIHAFTCEKKLIYSKDTKSHCHFICEKCNKTVHIDIKDIKSLKKSLSGEICHFQIDIYGVCEKCLSNKDGM